MNEQSLKPNSRIFIISDTHFSHANIIKYCSRPFKDVEEMDNTMIKNWNRVVKENDIVYHLGDFSFGGKDNVEKFLKKLNGKIILVKGNHDRCSNGHLRRIGFYEVYDRPIVIDNKIILSHEPLEVPPKEPYINIYGHVHDGSSYEDYTPNTACVCVERINYEPIPLNTVLMNIEAAKTPENH